MLTTFHNRVSLAALIVLCLMIAAGCQMRTESPTQSSLQDSDRSSRLSQVARQEVFGSANASAFSRAMSNPDVQAAMTMLETEGCSLVDTASLLLIKETWGWPVSADAALGGPPADDPSQLQHELLAADSIIWLVFETHPGNMQIHTAVLYGIHDGQEGVLVVEANISAGLPVAIREGKVVNQTFIPYDPTVNGFWLCVGAGLGSAVIHCAITGPCYAKCLGTDIAIVGAGCGIYALFGD